MLESWNDGPAKSAIVDFVGRVTAEGGPNYVAPEQRVAVFDNDGTLWCEKPMYIQLDFLLRRFKEQAEADESLREKQPYQAAYTGDLKWLGDAVTKHYQGDDGDFAILLAAILSAHHAITVEEHAARVNAFYAEAKHPTLGRPYTECGYAPMVELLRYLEGNGFTNYVVSGGGRDFMRPITGSMYGIPPERVVGSSVGLIYQNGQVSTTSEPEPHRAKANLRCRQLERRHRDAAVQSGGHSPLVATDGAARRRRPRIRLRHGRGEGTGSRQDPQLGGSEHEERLDDSLCLTCTLPLTSALR
jgi:phosphoglycolate phosphatase-like HAD superfamily hydrolase